MGKQRVFLTGATGTMGFFGLKELLKDSGEMDLVILARPSEKNKKLLAGYASTNGLDIVWGDLTNYDDVKTCVKDANIVLHVGAFVSPEADYHPKRAMEINYGSTVYIVNAIKNWGRSNRQSWHILVPLRKRETVCLPSTGDAWAIH